MNIAQFKRTVWNYYRAHGRDLPWRNTKDPYHILVSEIMLQQTQVSRVLEFFPRFLKQFPTLRTLSRASTSDVLAAWQGLGYNRRALALHKLAKTVSKLPQDYAALLELPGVGPATAGAIFAYAWNKPIPFIETNIRRVFIHHFFGNRGNVSDKEILHHAEKTLSRENPRQWYWALMDYGTHLSKTVPNPNRRSRHYQKQSKFEGSNRELRAKTLKLLLQKKTLSFTRLAANLNEPRPRISKMLSELIREGFVARRGSLLSIA